LTAGVITVNEAGFTLRVRLTPGAASDRIDGIVADAAGANMLAVRVRAKPENGRANAALEETLAKALGAPKSAVKVEKGTKARLKTVRVTGGGAALQAAQRLLEQSGGK
jgi:uncharacterized protein YggU (UPF0235/DUF167 family)